MNMGDANGMDMMKGAGEGKAGGLKDLIAKVQGALDELSAAIDAEEAPEEQQPAEEEQAPEAGGEAEPAPKVPYNKKKPSGLGF